MKKNILQYLEENAKKYPYKDFVIQQQEKISYGKFVDRAKTIASIDKLSSLENCQIAIYMDKGINCLLAMMGITYSGNSYCILDTKAPMDRINKIINSLQPFFVITDGKELEKAILLDIDEARIINIEDINEDIKEDVLKRKRGIMIDSDPLYVLFTSGSTGVPKGTVVGHRSVISYVQSVIEAFDIDENVIFGNQTPFYFSMSVLDIFTTIIAGGTLVIIPKMLFSFPVRLIEYMNMNKVNTIYWVPTAMGIISDRNVFNTIMPDYLNKILFAGEVMPTKKLNYWIKWIPNAMYANLYGPTEITDTGTYYIVNKKLDDDESVPIGKPFDNCGILLIKEDNTLAGEGEEGEICVRGSFLAYGYYNNWDKTQEVFCYNPVNKEYPELIYRTGDIGKYADDGNLIYITRKDFQIKHMGYRIELGEIENVINSIEGVNSCACIYDNDNRKIVFYYTGKISVEDIRNMVYEKLPNYMIPEQYIKLNRLPINANGKIDRKVLKQQYEERHY